MVKGPNGDIAAVVLLKSISAQVQDFVVDN